MISSLKVTFISEYSAELQLISTLYDKEGLFEVTDAGVAGSF